MATMLTDARPHISLHRVDHDSFRLLKEAFPWCYKKVGSTEWITLKYGGADTTFYKN